MLSYVTPKGIGRCALLPDKQRRNKMIDIKNLDETVMQSKTVEHIIKFLMYGNNGRIEYKKSKKRLINYFYVCRNKINKRRGGVSAKNN